MSHQASSAFAWGIAFIFFVISIILGAMLYQTGGLKLDLLPEIANESFTPPADCKSWIDVDGCNTCVRQEEGGPAVCTFTACHKPEVKQRCLESF